ncbi:MAG: class I SAM-dependent methyltransferase [Anaerolineae bacterium]
MAVGARTVKLLIEAMAKHLPPSASTLHLLDVGGRAGDILKISRADLAVTVVQGDPSAWPIEPNAFDAVVAFDHPQDDAFLAAALTALRQGGRLIMVSPEEQPGQARVETLEKAGYTRILVETGIECPLPVGALMRGEKPHTTDDTLARVKVAADNDTDSDADQIDWSTYNGRYVFLLVKQTPHKPAWMMTPEEPVEWHAVTIEQSVLAFSSLPKAVSFMQPAVLAKQINGVTKMAKFSRETAQTWPFAVRINPPVGALNGAAITWTAVDPASAETGDE